MQREGIAPSSLHAKGGHCPIELACKGRALPIEPAYTRAMMLIIGKQEPQQCVPSADNVGVALPAVQACWRDKTCSARTHHILSRKA